MKQEKRKELLLIIPAYNEEKNIGGLLDRMKDAGIFDLADVLVMNDASRDRTAEVAAAHGARVITHVFNLGYGSGLQLGYKFARKNGYQYLIQMDADGQHDVCNVKAIYELLKRKDASGNCPDIVLGSRFVEGAPKYPTSLVKKMAYSIFRFFIRLGTGKKYMDPTTRLQGLSRRAFCFYAGYNHFDDMYPDANMIMQMTLLGFSVEEVPAVMHPRTEGKSMHSGLKPFVYMFRMTFSILAVWVRIRLYKVDVGAINEFSEEDVLQ